MNPFKYFAFVMAAGLAGAAIAVLTVIAMPGDNSTLGTILGTIAPLLAMLAAMIYMDDKF